MDAAGATTADVDADVDVDVALVVVEERLGVEGQIDSLIFQMRKLNMEV